jgi:hypothetical protein
MSKSSHHSFYFNEDSRGVLDALYDFSRCQRADGSYYGTAGQCRIGKEVGAKDISMLKAATRAGNKKAKLALDVVEGRKTKAQARRELKEMETVKPPTPAKDPKAEYASLMKRQQELVQKGDIAGAMKLNDKIKAAMKEASGSPEQKAADANLKKSAEERSLAQKNFEAAQARREAGQTAANLSPKDKKAIEDYTKETQGQSARSYDNMNTCLRSPSTCPDPSVSKKFTKEFDAALGKLPKNENGDEFFRGVQVRPGQTEQLYKALQNAKPGTKMKDPGYGSFSAERRQAEFFTARDASNIIFVTRSKSITPINMYSKIQGENEAILPRGTEQTIRKVTKEGKNLIVELD